MTDDTQNTGFAAALTPDAKPDATTIAAKHNEPGIVKPELLSPAGSSNESGIVKPELLSPAGSSNESGIVKPELLSPAGSFTALEAAIEAGADAVYFGGSAFNARMRAENIADGDIKRGVALCHAYGVKAYVTLNTRLYDRELCDALRIASDVYDAGADALIIADIGLGALVRKAFPDFELHASTQMSASCADDCNILYDMGYSRVVCPRESTSREIKELCEKSRAEIEMFIHGAHCTSFSGQCLMSFAFGERSGNRGDCAQPCRLEYSLDGSDNTHPISLRDMCLAGHIPEILTLGVASLKLEGRQKSPEYVYGTTKIYRRLIDERRSATADEISELSAIFSRGGFTDGYFTGDYRKMCGFRRAEDAQQSRSYSPDCSLKRKVPVTARLTAKEEAAASLEIASPFRTAIVYGDMLRRASDGERVPTEEMIKEKLSRLGSTPFELKSAEINGGAFITLSQINALRRNAAEALMRFERLPADKITNGAAVSDKAANDNEVRSDPDAQAGPAGVVCKAGVFQYPGQIPEQAWEFFDIIYLPLRFGAHECAATLDFRQDGDSMRRELLRHADSAKGSSAQRVLVHSLSQLSAARRAALAPDCSLRLNVFNSRAAYELQRIGAASYTLSPELSAAAMGHMPPRKAVAVYGKLELMYTVRCLISDGKHACRQRDDSGLCLGKMTDRRGVRVPVIGQRDCSNIVLNPVPLYMADRPGIIDKIRADRLYFMFTDETRNNAARLISSISDHSPLNIPVRRVK